MKKLLIIILFIFTLLSCSQNYELDEDLESRIEQDVKLKINLKKRLTNQEFILHLGDYKYTNEIKKWDKDLCKSIKTKWEEKIYDLFYKLYLNEKNIECEWNYEKLKGVYDKVFSLNNNENFDEEYNLLTILFNQVEPKLLDDYLKLKTFKERNDFIWKLIQRVTKEEGILWKINFLENWKKELQLITSEWNLWYLPIYDSVFEIDLDKKDVFKKLSWKKVIDDELLEELRKLNILEFDKKITLTKNITDSYYNFLGIPNIIRNYYSDDYYLDSNMNLNYLLDIEDNM